MKSEYELAELRQWIVTHFGKKSALLAANAVDRINYLDNRVAVLSEDNKNLEAELSEACADALELRQENKQLSARLNQALRDNRELAVMNLANVGQIEVLKKVLGSLTARQNKLEAQLRELGQTVKRFENGKLTTDETYGPVWTEADLCK